MHRSLIYKDIERAVHLIKSGRLSDAGVLTSALLKEIEVGTIRQPAAIRCIKALDLQLITCKELANSKIIPMNYDMAVRQVGSLCDFPPILKCSELNVAKQPFGIACFGFSSTERIRISLEAIKKNKGIGITTVWIDGDQGHYEKKKRIDEVERIARSYEPFKVIRRRGNYGFRRMMLDALTNMAQHYDQFLILEDDCMLAKDGLEILRSELEKYKDNDRILSVYGSHFGIPTEFPFCTRFQGWGWATWSSKIIPFVEKMKRLYLLDETNYLHFVKSCLTHKVCARIDVTKGREASLTLSNFYAWDETLTLLSALEDKLHRPSIVKSVYNFGMDSYSSHFPDNPKFRNSPFNMITPTEALAYLESY